MNFVRSEAGLRKNCRLGPREQFNEVSSVLDAGTVYSNDPELLEELRFQVILSMSKEIKWSGVTTQAVQEWTFENPARLCRAQLHGHDAFEGQSRIRHGFFCKLTLF